MTDEKRDEETEEPSFAVKDRRRFTSEGEVKEGEDVGSDTAAAEPERFEPAPEDEVANPTAALPEMDFGTFVMSLARSTLMHLEGEELPDGSKRKDLELARQSIDILAMLKEKTEGNLTEEEEKMLEQVLYELRMVFISAAG